MRRIIATLVIGIAAFATGACDAPTEDSLETTLIMATAEHEWRNDYATLPCVPQRTYEVFPQGTYIGVVGECVETSIGAWIPAGIGLPSYGRTAP